MNALSIFWPGFTTARRIARIPVRFLVAGLEACVDFGRYVSISDFRWLAALVMFALVFGCGAAAMTWAFAIAGLTYAAHTGLTISGSAVLGLLYVTAAAYLALLTPQLIEL
ncbi:MULTISPECIES: hypothetical protein [Pseudomonas]|uniref:hypothetical protein n=1 Tax=Pseudomonas TaxID=286 RepID=UPI0004D1CD50|nr:MULTISPECIES: hypothetical protein [Pseudomonas]AIG02422.1 hypothetical protein HZ99_09760 [Pseudomonas fluorescens]